MTAWDLRTFLRALVATLIGIAVVWLVTAASDEGQLTVSVRAGRTLPLAPLCSAIGAALALGTARVRDETRALEALGRSPGQTARAAALGAALPSLLIGIAIGLSSIIDVSGFYPRAPRGDAFVYADGAFTSPNAMINFFVDELWDDRFVESDDAGEQRLTSSEARDAVLSQLHFDRTRAIVARLEFSKGVGASHPILQVVPRRERGRVAIVRESRRAGQTAPPGW